MTGLKASGKFYYDNPKAFGPHMKGRFSKGSDRHGVLNINKFVLCSKNLDCQVFEKKCNKRKTQVLRNACIY